MSSIASKTYESAPLKKVAFLGLGVMGYPMAGHLARAGHAVTVYNRSPAKAQAWVRDQPNPLISVLFEGEVDGFQCGFARRQQGIDQTGRKIRAGPDRDNMRNRACHGASGRSG